MIPQTQYVRGISPMPFRGHPGVMRPEMRRAASPGPAQFMHYVAAPNGVVRREPRTDQNGPPVGFGNSMRRSASHVGLHHATDSTPGPVVNVREAPREGVGPVHRSNAHSSSMRQLPLNPALRVKQIRQAPSAEPSTDVPVSGSTTASRQNVGIRERVFSGIDSCIRDKSRASPNKTVSISDPSRELDIDSSRCISPPRNSMHKIRDAVRDDAALLRSVDQPERVATKCPIEEMASQDNVIQEFSNALSSQNDASSPSSHFNGNGSRFDNVVDDKQMMIHALEAQNAFHQQRLYQTQDRIQGLEAECKLAKEECRLRESRPLRELQKIQDQRDQLTKRCEELETSRLEMMEEAHEQKRELEASTFAVGQDLRAKDQECDRLKKKITDDGTLVEEMKFSHQRQLEDMRKQLAISEEERTDLKSWVESSREEILGTKAMKERWEWEKKQSREEIERLRCQIKIKMDEVSMLSTRSIRQADQAKELNEAQSRLKSLLEERSSELNDTRQQSELLHGEVRHLTEKFERENAQRQSLATKNAELEQALLNSSTSENSLQDIENINTTLRSNLAEAHQEILQLKADKSKLELDMRDSSYVEQELRGSLRQESQALETAKLKLEEEYQVKRSEYIRDAQKEMDKNDEELRNAHSEIDRLNSRNKQDIQELEGRLDEERSEATRVAEETRDKLLHRMEADRKVWSARLKDLEKQLDTAHASHREVDMRQKNEPKLYDVGSRRVQTLEADVEILRSELDKSRAYAKEVDRKLEISTGELQSLTEQLHELRENQKLSPSCKQDIIRRFKVASQTTSLMLQRAHVELRDGIDEVTKLLPAGTVPQGVFEAHRETFNQLQVRLIEHMVEHLAHFEASEDSGSSTDCNLGESGRICDWRVHEELHEELRRVRASLLSAEINASRYGHELARLRHLSQRSQAQHMSEKQERSDDKTAEISQRDLTMAKQASVEENLRKESSAQEKTIRALNITLNEVRKLLEESHHREWDLARKVRDFQDQDGEPQP